MAAAVTPDLVAGEVAHRLPPPIELDEDLGLRGRARGLATAVFDRVEQVESPDSGRELHFEVLLDVTVDLQLAVLRVREERYDVEARVRLPVIVVALESLEVEANVMPIAANDVEVVSAEGGGVARMGGLVPMLRKLMAQRLNHYVREDVGPIRIDVAAMIAGALEREFGIRPMGLQRLARGLPELATADGSPSDDNEGNGARKSARPTAGRASRRK